MSSKRAMFIKIRIVLREPMTKRVALTKLRRAIHARRVPAGIDIAGIDWQRGEGFHMRSGSYTGQKAHDALVSMAKVIDAAQQKRIGIEFPDGHVEHAEL